MVPSPAYTDIEVPAMAYHRLEGQPLDQAPDGLWPERLGRFLYDLHLMPPEYVELRGRTASAVREESSEELAALRRDVLPLLESDEAEWFQRRFTAFLDREDYWRFSACLTHGDIGPEHVLVSASGDLVGVLDWEELVVGDPVADFAWLLHARPDDGERVLGAYGGAPDPTFAERAAFRFFLMPFHEVVYGLQIDDPGFVASGIAGIRARADVVAD
jgi:aminoglycoside phosphotransferase (APT) family kinase protein